MLNGEPKADYCDGGVVTVIIRILLLLLLCHIVVVVVVGGTMVRLITVHSPVNCC